MGLLKKAEEYLFEKNYSEILGKGVNQFVIDDFQFQQEDDNTEIRINNSKYFPPLANNPDEIGE